MSRVLAEEHTVADIEARELELERRLRDYSSVSIRAELKMLREAKPLAEAKEQAFINDAVVRLGRATETYEPLREQVSDAWMRYVEISKATTAARSEYERSWDALRGLRDGKVDDEGNVVRQPRPEVELPDRISPLLLPDYRPMTRL